MFRFPPDVITVAVRWYLRYGLSYRDVVELLAERGITVDWAPGHVQRVAGDGVALQGEQDDDGEQQPVEREGSDRGQELALVPVAARSG